MLSRSACIFSFSHNVSILSETSLTIVENDRTSENTVGNGEIARNKQFLFFPLCFLLGWRTF